MKYSIPEDVARRLAHRAVEIAQVIGPRKTGKGLNSLIPVYQKGQIGIQVPDETAYMYDLDQGVEAHAMVDLAGRVIPVRNPDGTIAFRRAGANKIGKIPVITRLSSNGKLKGDTPEWYYPQKQGLNFLNKAIQMSVDEWKRTSRKEDIINMFMKTEARSEIEQIIHGRSSN